MKERDHEENWMVFNINGVQADVISGGRSIGEVLSELDERAENMGMILVELRIDDTIIDPDRIAEASQLDASGAGRVDLIAEPAAEIKARALETLLELVRATMPTLEAVNNEARETARKAWESYRLAFGGLFSAEEASFIDAFRGFFDSDALVGDASRIGANLEAFFGERLAELQNPAEAMVSAARVFDSIKDDLCEVPVRLQTGKDAEAMRTMVVAVELIHKTVRILPEFMRSRDAQTLEIDGSSLPEFYGKFNDVLRELAGAFENKDGVLIGDLAEYEIKPRLESFFTAIRRSVVAA
jgi:hypothetical protein